VNARVKPQVLGSVATAWLCFVVYASRRDAMQKRKATGSALFARWHALDVERTRMGRERDAQAKERRNASADANVQPIISANLFPILTSLTRRSCIASPWNRWPRLSPLIRMLPRRWSATLLLIESALPLHSNPKSKIVFRHSSFVNPPLFPGTVPPVAAGIPEGRALCR
jgi:hypothetical protein